MQNIEIKTLTQYRNPNGEVLVRQQIKLKELKQDFPTKPEVNTYIKRQGERT